MSKSKKVEEDIQGKRGSEISTNYFETPNHYPAVMMQLGGSCKSSLQDIILEVSKWDADTRLGDEDVVHLDPVQALSNG